MTEYKYFKLKTFSNLLFFCFLNLNSKFKSSNCHSMPVLRYVERFSLNTGKHFYFFEFLLVEGKGKIFQILRRCIGFSFYGYESQ